MSADTAAAGAAAASSFESMNRAEKKTWKALQKFGLELQPDIVKVEIRRLKGQPPVVVDAPRVYKVPGPTPTYVVLGALRLHNMQESARTALMRAQQQALSQARVNQAAAAASASASGAETGTVIEEVAGTGEPEVDASGLDEEDIKMAVEQTGRSRKAVVEALRAHSGDLVETIMALTG